MALRNCLIAVLIASPVFAAPTVADARTFMDRAEAELMKLGVMDNRADWVHETFITDDTELLAASEDEKVIARTTELVNEGKQYESLNLPPDLKRKFLLLKLSLTMPAPKDAKLREELTQTAAWLRKCGWAGTKSERP
jgi:peptidyl-dipeptidase A